MSLDEIIRTSWRADILVAVCACLLLSVTVLLIFPSV
jgi:hypothetical protein